MSEPRSIRLDASTAVRLSSFVARHPGWSQAGAIARLLDEALRMDAHPALIFRDGPTGRRAGIITGPDVWEIIRAVRDTRAAEPDLTGEEIVDLVTENTGTAPASVRAALAYFGEHADEVEALMDAADRAEAELEVSMRRTSALLST